MIMMLPNPVIAPDSNVRRRTRLRTLHATEPNHDVKPFTSKVPREFEDEEE
jgi:hypothetical protein